MAEITGGSVSYGRTINTGDYNSKKAEVMLTFALGEGESAEGAAEQAVFLCHKILTQISAGAASRSATTDSEAKPSTEEAPVDATPATGTETKRKPRATKPPTPAAEPTPLEAAIAQSPATEDPAAVEEPATPALSGETESATASADGFDPDPASIEDDFAPVPREVTDVELTTAAAKKNGELSNATKIRELVGKYVQHPKKMTDIPQPERGKFLEDLAALKP